MADYKKSLVLTGLYSGYQAAEMVGYALFPRVDIQEDKALVPTGKGGGMIIYDTVRAEGARSNRVVANKKGSVEIEPEEHDLETPIDKKKLKLKTNADGGFTKEDEVRVAAVKEEKAEFVSFGLALRKEYDQAGLAQDESNYPATNKLIITSASDRITDPNSDLIGYHKGARSAIRKSRGAECNVCLMNWDVFDAHTEHPQIKAKLGAGERKIINRETLADILGYEKIVIGASVAEDAVTGEKLSLWEDNIIIAYIPPLQPNEKRTKARPLFGITLHDNRPISEYVDVHGEDDSKIILVRKTECRKIALVDTSAGYIIKNVLTGGA